jgi:DNA-binding transcriptional MerR regulator
VIAPDDGFRGPQVCAITGITYRQLDYWLRTGVVRSSISAASGSGSQRRFSRADLQLIALAACLFNVGIPGDVTRSTVATLATADLDNVMFVVVRGPQVTLATTVDELVAAVMGDPALSIVVPAAEVVAKVNAKADEYAAEWAAAQTPPQPAPTPPPPCGVDGCEQPGSIDGFCFAHNRLRDLEWRASNQPTVEPRPVVKERVGASLDRKAGFRIEGHGEPLGTLTIEEWRRQRTGS